MRKYIGTILIIVSFCTALFVSKGFGAFVPVAAKTEHATITLTNASPDAGAIDVYIDHQLAKTNVSTTDPRCLHRGRAG